MEIAIYAQKCSSRLLKTITVLKTSCDFSPESSTSPATFNEFRIKRLDARGERATNIKSNGLMKVPGGLTTVRCAARRSVFVWECANDFVMPPSMCAAACDGRGFLARVCRERFAIHIHICTNAGSAQKKMLAEELILIIFKYIF